MSETKISSHLESQGNGLPSTPDPLDSSDTERTELTERIQAFTVENVAALRFTLDRELFVPFYTCFREAARIHSDLVQQLNLEAENPSLTSEVVREYRRAANKDVLQPIRRQLETPPIDVLNARYRALFDKLREGIDWGDDIRIVQEPPMLFTPKADDTAWILVRKFFLRRRRGLQKIGHSLRNGLSRLTGNQGGEAGIYVRTIPVSHLITYHLQARLPRCLQPAFDDFHQCLVGYIARYEKTQTDWVYGILDAEQKLAQPDYAPPIQTSWVHADEEPPGQPHTDSITKIHERVEALQTVLNLPEDDIHEAFDRLDEKLSLASSELLDDLKAGGTFLLNLKDRPIPSVSRQSAKTFLPRHQHWIDWYREVNNRLLATHKLGDLRNFLQDGESRLLESIASASLTPIYQSLQRLKTSLEEVQEESATLFAGQTSTDTETTLSDQIQRLRERISAQFKFILSDLTGLLKAGQALEVPGAHFWKRFNEYVSTLPDLLSVHEPLPNPPVRDSFPGLRYEINLREAVQNSLMLPLPPQLEQPARSLQKAVVHTWEEIQQVEQMVDYNLNAALNELTAPEPSSDGAQSITGENPTVNPNQEDEEEHDPIEAARELIDTGLIRSSEKLTELVSALRPSWEKFVDVTFTSLQTYSKDIHSNISSEDNQHDWWTKFRIRLNRRIRHFRQDLTNAFEDTVSWVNALIRRGRRQTKQLIKIGQSAVGVVGQSEDQWLKTLQMVSDIDTLHKDLPLVYRRLFSLRPLEDLDLLEGRKLDIAFVKKHFERWQSSLTGPLILSMPYGSGRSSLMNVLQDTVFQEADVKFVRLDQRFSDSDAWAATIAGELDLSSDGPMTIDLLEETLMAQSRSEKPLVVIVDRLEHLLLRAPGGDEVIERVLLLFSRTDNAVYWIATIGHYAWHFLEKTLRPSSGFIAAYHVTKLQRQALEDIILKRHHRSGMALRFKATSASSSFFDFSGPKDENSQQESLKSAFFDRLYRLSGQNILLALVYWLRTVKFDEENDLLAVSALEPIDFSFLETLDLTRAFTLKSFLIHRTLTLDEHMRVFRSSMAESTIILESLLNLGIILPALREDQESRHFRIVPDVPYRVHPLIVHPVTQFLKKLHVIY